MNGTWLSCAVCPLGWHPALLTVAAIIGIVLDNIILGTPEDRGLNIPSLLVPEAADVGEGGNRAGTDS